jgi:hypothetical protein
MPVLWALGQTFLSGAPIPTKPARAGYFPCSRSRRTFLTLLGQDRRKSRFCLFFSLLVRHQTASTPWNERRWFLSAGNSSTYRKRVAAREHWRGDRERIADL